MNRLLILLLVLLPSLTSAAPSPASIFTDGAVLQQGANIPVWGRAEPGEHITVSFRDQQVGTSTDAEGNWQVLLAPIAADTTESELCIQGSTTVTLHRLLVGDVWLCVGDAALQTTLDHDENARAEIPSAALPLLRYVDASTSQAPATPAGGPEWHEASPAYAAHFSAEAYFFAKQLQRKTGLPIGIIKVSALSGTPAAWLSPAAINSNPSLAFIPQRWQEAQSLYPAKMQAFQQALNEWKKSEQKARDSGPAKLAAFHQRKQSPQEPRLHRPSAHFESLLAPIQPYALKAIVWHEGEVEGLNATEFAAATRTFIQSTRAHFGNPELPLIMVQLGPQPPTLDINEENWALLRAAQNAALDIPHTNMIVSLDHGGPKAVHIFNPQDIARRLAQTALATIYNVEIEYKGPSIKGSALENGKLRLDFDHAATGLIAYKKPVQALEIAGADGHFFPATAVIRGSSLLISSPSVPAPQSVRYAWNKAPYANLANGAGIPAAPFCFQRSPSIQAPYTTPSSQP